MPQLCRSGVALHLPPLDPGDVLPGGLLALTTAAADSSNSRNSKNYNDGNHDDYEWSGSKSSTRSNLFDHQHHGDEKEKKNRQNTTTKVA